MMYGINFSATKEEFEIIASIVDRAMNELPGISRVTLLMDLSAVHANDCGLRLEELRDAEMFDFAHDIYGIMHHMNRKAGKLENCFLPRYAKRGGLGNE